MDNIVEVFEDRTRTIRGVEVFATGVHNGKTFNEDDLETIVESFKAVENEIKPPVKLGHNNQIPLQSGLPAVGWMTNMRKEGEKLLVDFENVPKKVVEMIENGMFKRVSMEFIKYYIADNGEKYERVPKGVALLGADIPAVKTLEDVNELLSDSENDKVEAYTMKLNEDETEDFEEDEEEDVDQEENTDEDEEEEEDTEDMEDEETNDNDDNVQSNPTQKGGQTLDIQEFVEEFENLSDDEQSELLSELGVESEEDFSEEYVNKLEETVESLEAKLEDQKIEAFLDEKVQEGTILDKNREEVKDIVQSFDSEKFEDTSERLDKVEVLLEGKQAVDTEEYSEDGDVPSDEDGDEESYSDQSNEELVEQITEA